MKVLIADDHALIRQGMAYALLDKGVATAIVEADDKDSVIQQIEAEPDIDIVLLDLFMPGTKEFDLLCKLCDTYPELSVIVVSAAEESHYMRKSIDYGAAGFIPKSASMDIMLSAIQLVRSGGIYIPPGMMQASTPTGSGSEDYLKSDTSKQTDREDFTDVIEAAKSLTNRQKQVLVLLAKGMSNKEIARELSVSEHTVKIHVTAILRLFRASNRTEVVVKTRNANILDDI